MKQCAFLTMDSLDNFVHYDYLLNEPLEELGWEVTNISWRDPDAEWDAYDAIVIRSPWDYQDNSDQFIEVLERIDASSSRLENSLDLVRWNIDKTYLNELEQWGLPVVPTLWGTVDELLTPEKLMQYFDRFRSTEIVIKPTVSAGAEFTYRLTKEEARNQFTELETVFRNKAWMVQPFVNAVVSEGEYSLIYFGEQYSHSLLKTPKHGDFRVQEEYGGILKSVEPEAELKRAADKILADVNPTPLYSRVDMVRTEGGFKLMELELIEPSLYFNMDPESPERFARFFDDWMSSVTTKKH